MIFAFINFHHHHIPSILCSCLFAHYCDGVPYQKSGIKQAHLDSIYARFERTITRTEHLDFTSKPQFHASLDFLAVRTHRRFRSLQSQTYGRHQRHDVPSL